METLQDSQVWTLFAADANHALQEVEQGLLALEHAPGSSDEINRLYRALHTLKGNSALLSLKNIETLAHSAEDVMVNVRDGSLRLDQDLADMLLGTVDVLRQATSHVASAQADVPKALIEAEVAKLKRFLGKLGAQPEFRDPAARVEGGVFLFSEAPPAAAAALPVALLIPPSSPQLDPDTLGMFLALARSALMPDGVLLTSTERLSQALLLLRGAAQRLDLAELLANMNALEQKLRNVESVSEEQLAPLVLLLAQLERTQAGTSLGAASYGFAEHVAREQVSAAGPAAEAAPMAAQPAERAALASREGDAARARTSVKAPPPPAAGDAGARAELLRIDARKVSLVMDLVGEVSLACSAVTHHPEIAGLELDGFASAAHKLEMLVRELQNEVTALRMVPIASVFQPMRRVVRDAARRTSKDVELIIRGEDTEIDKVMVDALHDPLVHVLRNAVDHGLETREGRRAAGKPDIGKLVLEAGYHGGEVCVTVSDDGQGLNRTKIRARAFARGLCKQEAPLSDAQLLELVFLPGFSTKEQADELSGRGVGMDVIKTSIERLRGRVGLQSTEGLGTVVSMTVPLTLAFLDAMVVRDEGRLYAIPVERVREVFKAESEQVCHSAVDGQSMLRVRDQLIPVRRLSEYYRGEPHDPDMISGSVVVVVQTANGELGIPVEALLGNQPVMLKPLRGVIANIRAAAGCGMLRSGDVALTLDCERLHAV